MAQECTHQNQIRYVTPSAQGCEDCLKTGDMWVHLRICLTAATSAVAITRKINMPRSTTTLPITQSSNPSSRERIGAGVMWTRCRCDVRFQSQDFLRQLPLFAGLSEEDLGRLCAMAKTETLPAGEVLMEEGSLGDALYVILDGTFEITKRSHDARPLDRKSWPGRNVGRNLAAGTNAAQRNRARRHGLSRC